LAEISHDSREISTELNIRWEELKSLDTSNNLTNMLANTSKQLVNTIKSGNTPLFWSLWTLSLFKIFLS